MAIEHPGYPTWRHQPQSLLPLIFDDGELNFDHAQCPEYEAACEAWFNKRWGSWREAINYINGRTAPDTPAAPHPEIARIHDAVKANIGHDLSRPWSGVPFWSAQAEAIGGVGFAGDEALVKHLQHVYAYHAGPQTKELVEAARALRVAELPLLQRQLEELKDATYLSISHNGDLIDMPAEEFARRKPELIRRLEATIADNPRAIERIDAYLADFDRLRATPPGAWPPSDGPAPPRTAPATEASPAEPLRPAADPAHPESAATAEAPPAADPAHPEPAAAETPLAADPARPEPAAAEASAPAADPARPEPAAAETPPAADPARPEPAATAETPPAADPARPEPTPPVEPAPASRGGSSRSWSGGTYSPHSEYNPPATNAAERTAERAEATFESAIEHAAHGRAGTIVATALGVGTFAAGLLHLRNKRINAQAAVSDAPNRQQPSLQPEHLRGDRDNDSWTQRVSEPGSPSPTPYTPTR